MPTYQIETNQGTFEIDADREPTPQDIQRLMAAPSDPSPVASSFARSTPEEPWRPFFSSKEEFDAAKARQETDNPESLPAKAGMAGRALTSAALKVGVPAAAIAASPFTGGASLVAVGGLAGMAGEYGGNLVAGDDTTLGGLASAGIANAVPGGNVLKTGVTGLIKAGARDAVTNLAASQAQAYIDDGRLLSPEEAATSASMGALAPVVAKTLRGNAAAVLPDNPIPRGVQEDIYNSIAEMKKLGVKDGRGRVIKSVVVDPGSVHDKTPSAAKFFAGRAALNQDASVMNADAIQAAAREAIGLSPEARPLNKDTIKAVITEAYEPYQKIQAIQKQAKAQLATLERQALTESSGHGSAIQMDSPDFHRMADPLRIQASADVEALKLARLGAHREMEKIHAQAADASYDKFRAYKDEAEALSDNIEKAAEISGDKELLKRLKESRVRIAQGYSLMSAVGLNGIVDARKLAAQMSAGAPLSGNLRALARFADAVSKDTIPINRAGDPNINQLTGQIGLGAAAVHPQTGVLALGMPFIGKKAREKLLAEEFQKNMFATTRESRTAKLLEALARFGTMKAGRTSSFLPQPVEER